jgi:hypothetical protein
MLDANARGTLQAEELLGKSKCQLLPFFDQTHSMEGIEPLPAEGELECLELARPQPITGELESKLRGRPQPIAGELESVERPQPIAGVLASLTGRPQPIAGVLESELRGQTHPIAGELESGERPQPIAGVLAVEFTWSPKQSANNENETQNEERLSSGNNGEVQCQDTNDGRDNSQVWAPRRLKSLRINLLPSFGKAAASNDNNQPETEATDNSQQNSLRNELLEENEEESKEDKEESKEGKD